MSNLANPEDPLVTTDGKVYGTDHKEINYLDYESKEFARKAVNITSSVTRSITDMPAADIKVQTAINVILCYQILGLSDNEISYALDLALSEIEKYKIHSAYQTTYDMMFSELININGDNILSKIAANATSAVDSIINLVSEGDKDIVKLKAAQDIVDRSGLSLKDLQGNSSLDDDTLHIVIENTENNKTEVNVNISGKRRG